ncbi:MAG: hypothetical protein MUF18_21950 [Fimbriiglobus sp.]|nr:hypothetical protein [Fimbriiglobus sp.]
MTFNLARLNLESLDRRDVPSVVAVEKPPEYATASVEYQQAYDQSYADGVGQVDAVNLGSTPDEQLDNADKPNPSLLPPPGAQRDYTPEELAEIEKLTKLLEGIKEQKKLISAAKSTYDAALTGAVSVGASLLNDLKAAKAAATAVQKALDDWDAGYKAFKAMNPPLLTIDGLEAVAAYQKLAEIYGNPKNRDALVKLRDEANGKVAGLETAVVTAAAKVKLIQQRLDYLAIWSTYYDDWATAVNARLDAIRQAVINNVASGTPLDVTTNPIKAISFPASFKNIDKPLFDPALPTDPSGGLKAPVPGK